MKFKLIIIFCLLFSSCLLKQKSGQPNLLTYNQVHSFTIGLTTQSKVEKSLGAPNSRSEMDGYFSFEYVDRSSGFQRLSLNFLSVENKLLSLLWIPKEGEKEYSIKQARSYFPNAKFEIVNEQNENPHFYTDVISYIDKKYGIKIRYDRARDAVEAIAKYDQTYRKPATSQRTNVSSDLSAKLN